MTTKYRMARAASPAYGGSGYESCTPSIHALKVVHKGYDKALDAFKDSIVRTYADGTSWSHPGEYESALAQIDAARSNPSQPELRLTIGSDVHILREDGPAPDLKKKD